MTNKPDLADDGRLTKQFITELAGSPPASVVAEPVAYRYRVAGDDRWCLSNYGTGQDFAQLSNNPHWEVEPLGVIAATTQPAQAATVSDVVTVPDLMRALGTIHRGECDEIMTREIAGKAATTIASLQVLLNNALASSPAAPAPVIPESEKGGREALTDSQGRDLTNGAPRA